MIITAKLARIIVQEYNDLVFRADLQRLVAPLQDPSGENDSGAQSRPQACTTKDVRVMNTVITFKSVFEFQNKLHQNEPYSCNTG